jgi:plastocyanin
MNSRLRWIVCAAATGVALGAPGAASAAVKSVTMGPSGKAVKTLQNTYESDVDAFFPSGVAVHVGDSVKFVPVSFHTVHFLGRSGKAAPVVIATKKLIAGVNDAAGVPFGFNGKPELNFNPVFFAPGKLGKTVVTDGTKQFTSGLPFAEHPKPMTVRFTKPGLFKYICDVHAGMKGTVRVVPASAAVPSAAADAKRVSTQITKAIAVAKGFKTVKPPANTVNVGMFGRGGVSLFGFVPKKLTVAIGTTVTFRSVGGNSEIHTASTGLGNPEKDPKSYLGKIAKSFEEDNQPPQIGINASDGGANPLLSSALHGNGFWNAGVLDDVSLTTVLTNKQQVTFAQAGTYEFYCLIHPFMHATITAQ